MKKIILVISLFASLSAQAAEYGIHLFFNETEFIDVLKIEKDADGKLTGHMFVPDDFEGAVDNLKIEDQKISFDLFVPKNSSRPEDLIFRYEGQFFDASHAQLVGYVTLKNESAFVASFVGFLRN